MATKTTKKTPSKNKSRMCASAARADGAAKTQRALREAKRASDANIKAIDAKQKKAKKPEAGTKAKLANIVARANDAAKLKRPSGLDLAAKVLAKASEPLNAKAIAERTIAAGWKTNGKTPHATLYAAIAREISTKGKEARFRKTDRGLFAANKGVTR